MNPNEIVNVESRFGEIRVVRTKTPKGSRYDVYAGGVLRHPQCSAESAMRALGTYLIAPSSRT